MISKIIVFLFFIFIPSFIEFKEYLYSSPMAVPRDDSRAKTFLYPCGGTDISQLPCIVPVIVEMQQGSVLVTRPRERNVGRERVHPLSLFPSLSSLSGGTFLAYPPTRTYFCEVAL